MSNYIKVSEYAQEKGVTPRTIYRWSQKGDIEVKEIDGVLHVKVDNESNGDNDIISQIKSQNGHLQEEIDYLRTRLAQAQEALTEAQARHDMIVAQLTQQNQLLLEDMRHRSLWQRVKAALGFAG